ncbi:MAG: DNA replication and repair protein RecF [bacterium]
MSILALFPHKSNLMQVKSLTLNNFRNHLQKRLEFKDINIITGPNASGKTGILEALYLLSGKNSPRVEKTPEIVNWHKDYSRIEADLSNGTRLEVFVDANKNYAPTKYKANENSKLKRDFEKNITAVLFSHDDLGLLTGSPSKRREYINNSLCFNNRYSQHITQYGSVLRSRNRLLEQIREGLENRSALYVWDEKLIKLAQPIEKDRREYFTFLEKALPGVVRNFNNLFIGGTCKAHYHAKEITTDWLAEARPREIASAQTLRGPHRADFSIQVGGREQGVFASRGQQRALIIALKVCEAAFIELTTGNKPIILLDDVYSELDSNAQTAIQHFLNENQVFITTTLPLNADNWGKNMSPDRQAVFFELSPRTD